ncbi:MAG: hypothetical protein AB1611_02095 [bacterium]
MKQQLFKLMVILFLAYAFISGPGFASRALAGEGKSADQRPLVRAVKQAMGQGDSLPDLNITIPTTIPELIDMVMNSEIAQQVKGVYQKRMEARAERVEKLRDFFNRNDQSSD